MYSKSSVGQAKISISYLSQNFHFTSHTASWLLASVWIVDVCVTSHQQSTLQSQEKIPSGLCITKAAQGCHLQRIS